MRVFISHSSKDKPVVEELARALRERGIDAWLDKWEIGPGQCMGDLYTTMGQGENARHAYFKLMAITERLVQAEPERADYQIDLVVCPIKVGGTDEPDAGAHLQRALSILLSLRVQGRLVPVDEWKIPDLQEMLRERGLAGSRS